MIKIEHCFYKIVSLGIFVIICLSLDGQVIDVEYRQKVVFEEMGRMELTFHLEINKVQGLYYNTGDITVDLNDGNQQKDWDHEKDLPYIIKNYKSRTLVYNQPIIGRIVVIREALPLQVWKVLDVWKKIGDYDCQKAITEFRGRNYEAWFTDRIPIPSGPWKFDGLPGLILEVESLDKVLHISVVRLEERAEFRRPEILENEDQEAITWDEYVKKFNTAVKKIQKSVRADSDFETEYRFNINRIEVIDF